MKNFTKKEVLKAIKGSGGVVNQVKRNLKVSWETAKNYIYKWPETKKAFQDEREIIKDISETVIFDSIKDDRNVRDAKWLLTQLGKDRGYGDNDDRDRFVDLSGFAEEVKNTGVQARRANTESKDSKNDK